MIFYLAFLRLFTSIAPRDAFNRILPRNVGSWICPGSEHDLYRLAFIFGSYVRALIELNFHVTLFALTRQIEALESRVRQQQDE
jgi:hypothetical protein